MAWRVLEGEAGSPALCEAAGHGVLAGKLAPHFARVTEIDAMLVVVMPVKDPATTLSEITAAARTPRQSLTAGPAPRRCSSPKHPRGVSSSRAVLAGGRRANVFVKRHGVSW